MSEQSEPRVAAIVLAAGASTRFGSQKLLASLDGVPLVRWAASAATRSLAADVIAVVAPESDGVAGAFDDLPLRCVTAADARRGMSASLRAGLDALEPGTDAVVVVLGDQPRVGVSAINAVIAAHVASGAAIVQTAYANGERGHPVLFARALFDELRDVDGDRGGREVVERDPRRVMFVAIDLVAPRDVDTVHDLDAVRGADPSADPSPAVAPNLPESGASDAP